MPKSLGASWSGGQCCSGLGITEHMKKQCGRVIGRIICAMTKEDSGTLEPSRSATQGLDHDGPTICGGSNGGAMSRRPVG